MLIGGHSGFLFLDKDGKPKVAGHLEHAMKRIIDNYNKSHEVKLPRITPHVLRHTYCTDMANDGMEVQHLQYFMGYADTYTTLNTYTHSNYVAAEKAYAKIVSNR